MFGTQKYYHIWASLVNNLSVADSTQEWLFFQRLCTVVIPLKIIKRPSDTFWVSGNISAFAKPDLLGGGGGGAGTKHNQTRKKKKQKEETLISLSVKSTEKLTRSNCCDFLLVQICNRATNSSPKQYHFHRINFALSSLLLTSNLQKNDTYQSALNTNHHGTSSQLGWKF